MYRSSAGSAFDHCGRGHCLIWSTIKRCLGQSLECGGVVGCVGGDVRVVYNERVDIVVGDDVSNYLLVFFCTCYWTSTLLLRL